MRRDISLRPIRPRRDRADLILDIFMQSMQFLLICGSFGVIWALDSPILKLIAALQCVFAYRYLDILRR